jgi:predicted enzyme related to lactoylglutathione lyase
MPNHIRHFAIHADQVERARGFYEAVFDWRFEAWGPPDFYLIHTGSAEDRGLQGALQKRQTSVSGSGLRGFECTVGVDDLEDVLSRAVSKGAKILAHPFVIEGVGELAFIEDTEGNRLGIMRYEKNYAANMR